MTSECMCDDATEDIGFMNEICIMSEPRVALMQASHLHIFFSLFFNWSLADQAVEIILYVLWGFKRYMFEIKFRVDVHVYD